MQWRSRRSKCWQLPDQPTRRPKNPAKGGVFHASYILYRGSALVGAVDALTVEIFRDEFPIHCIT